MKARKKVLMVYTICFLTSCLDMLLCFRTIEFHIGTIIKILFISFLNVFSEGTIVLIVLIVFKNITIEQLKNDL